MCKSLVVLLALAPGLALASSFGDPEGERLDDFGTFIGIGGSYFKVHGSGVSTSTVTAPDTFKASGESYKAPLGIRFGRHFSLEGQYIDFGSLSSGDDRLKAHGWTADFVGSEQVTRLLIPYVKAGALFWSANRHHPSTAATDTETHSTGASFTWGAGTRVRIFPSLDFRVEYERFSFGGISQREGRSDGSSSDGLQANMVSGAFVFNF
jgi:opacity protein-like surface antigen